MSLLQESVNALTAAAGWKKASPGADGVFRFDVRGYGHRVGMSQYGANAIARLGFDYQTILRYYYRGAKIETQKGSLV